MVVILSSQGKIRKVLVIKTYKRSEISVVILSSQGKIRKGLNRTV